MAADFSVATYIIFKRYTIYIMDGAIGTKLREDFLKFIKSQSILGVAIGILIGQVFAKLVGSIIEGLIMPIFELFFGGTQWQEVTINLGRLHLRIGMVIASTLDFFVVSIVVFLLIKFFLKEEDKFIENNK